VIPFESFSYPFFDLNFNADYRALAASFLSSTGDNTQPGLKALYVHIPFCDTICSFCPFVKSVGTRDRISAYLDALHTELRQLACTPRVSAWGLDSIYIGGGTPSVLSEEQLFRLLCVIRENFNIKSNAEISLEFEAKSITDSKLALLASEGVTRVSFGVQTFDEITRRMINITASLDQVHRSIAMATKYFRNTNIDMMVGFPGQSVEAATADAAIAAKSGIGSVSIYPVDYVMTLPAWQDKIRSGDLPQPAPLAARSDMFHEARAELKNHMSEQNMYCFGSKDAPPTRYMFSTLYGGYYDECVGVGAGAYSFIRGLSYYNEASERTYVQRAAAGESPVSFASPGHAYEKGLVFFPKRMEFDLRALDDLGLKSTYADRVDAILNQGLATVENESLRLTQAGERVYSELMVHFFSDSQKRIYDRMCARLRSDVGIFDESDWIAGESRVRRMGAFSAMSTASTTRESRRSAG
jgi:oxygen-independent coproporphyrinogen-3 oxidase